MVLDIARHAISGLAWAARTGREATPSHLVQAPPHHGRRGQVLPLVGPQHPMDHGVLPLGMKGDGNKV